MTNEQTQSDGGDSRPRESVSAQGYVVRPTSDSHFSWIRTRLSADSTLMSWIRLSTTLIGFGFTIVQFFDRFGQMENVKPAVAPHLPRYVGLALIFSGVFGLLIAIWQYVRFVEYLNSGEFQRLAPKTRMPINRPTLSVAFIMVAIGVVAFISLLLRLS
jgi:putative membrane protein